MIISRTHKVSICIEICYKTLRKLDVGPNLKSKVGVVFNLNLKVNKKVVLSLWSPVAVLFCVLKEDRASVDSFLIPSSLTLFNTPHGWITKQWLWKKNPANCYFGKKSSFLHTFLKICCESRKILVKLKGFLISRL